MNIIDRLAELFTPVKALPEGVYHMQSPMEDEKPFRMHLRLQKDGSGILILNASTVLHLNPSAAEYAFHFIKGSEPLKAAKAISARYRIGKTQALQDYNDFVEKIHIMIHSTDLDPESVLGFEQVQPNSAELSAPLRLDCALTYRLPVGSDPVFAPTRRVARELTTAEWQVVMDKAWAAGIPHVIFTGGEATLRNDLTMLIAHAEKNGQVTGLLTDGIKLADNTYLESLLQTGLDHLMIILPINGEPNWQALTNAVRADIFLTIHLTVTPQNRSTAKAMLDKLREVGVENISLSVSDTSLRENVLQLRNHAAEIDLHLVSDLPVPYSEAHPLAFEAAEDAEPAGAGKAWLYVEPDGDVLPAQGFAEKVLGNILNDDWEKIYPSSK
jgi:hypothetical protein